ERLLEYLERVLLALAFDHLESAVDDRLGDRLLTLVHHRVHEFGDGDIPELRIGKDFAFFGPVAARHQSNSANYFGRFAPYFERRCLRFLTPWVSSTPR